jgi:hypothetical protein
VTDVFTKCNKRLIDCELSRSDLYLEILPRFSAGRVRLVDPDHLVNQFCSLERRALSGGHDKVDHGRGSHDDLSNAAAGALWCASRRRGITHISQSVRQWFLIQLGDDLITARRLQYLARVSGGTYFRFDPRTQERQFSEMWEAMSIYAAGGEEAVKTTGGQAATLLLQHLKHVSMPIIEERARVPVDSDIKE